MRAGTDAAGEERFRQLVVRQSRFAFRVAYAVLRDISDSEDVVQEVLVRAYNQVGDGRRISSAIAYLYRMTANACTDALRRRKRERRFAEHASVDPKPPEKRNVADEAARLEDLQRVERMVARLPRRQAEVVRLRVWDGLSFEQIAQVLGCPIGTVKSRFRYALVKLRHVMDQQREDRP